jgi:nucleotide-binding universal stress UspA family protein
VVVTDQGAVLLAYDGSEDAAAAIRRAGALLAERHAIVLHVWDSLSSLLLHTDASRLKGTMREAADELDAEDERQAELIVAQGVEIARHAGFEPEARTARGKPKAWPQILEVADSAEASVVVLGSRGLGRVDSALLGSVSSGLLHHSRRPVLVVPPGKPDAVGTPIVGYDGSDNARAAVRVAARLLAPREVRVETVWAPFARTTAVSAMGAPLAAASRAAEQIDREQAITAAHIAEEGARVADAEGLQAGSEAVQAAGSVWLALVERAELTGASMLILGSRGRSGPEAALLGSVSSGAVHHGSTPVLVVPPAR